MTVHPAALVLADHTYSYSSMDHGDHCACGWRGPRHVEHQADVLDRAGLLADGTPPGTPTTRALAERADRRAE